MGARSLDIIKCIEDRHKRPLVSWRATILEPRTRKRNFVLSLLRCCSPGGRLAYQQETPRQSPGLRSFVHVKTKTPTN
jgi:hypothetical protein